MRFLVRLKGDVSPDQLLESAKAIASSLGVGARNPKRTSYGALELDLFCSARGDFDLFLAAVAPLARSEFIRDLNVAPPFKEESELYEEARELFNAERFWECHEVLEGVWRTKQGPEKELLQGIILVCAAFVHHQKGEAAIALGVLRRSPPKLEHLPVYGGFDLEGLRRNVQSILASGTFVEFRI